MQTYLVLFCFLEKVSFSAIITTCKKKKKRICIEEFQGRMDFKTCFFARVFKITKIILKGY